MTRARDIANQGAGTYGSITADDLTVDTTTLVVDDTNNRVGIGTASPDSPVEISASLGTFSSTGNSILRLTNTNASGQSPLDWEINGTLRGRIRPDYVGNVNYISNGGNHAFYTGGDSGDGTERMRLDSSGALLIGKTTTASSVQGINLDGNFGAGVFARNDGAGLGVNRQNTDGALVNFLQADNLEGTISVSGTAVSYNGGHLSRWSRLADDSKDTSIVKGTVMTNLDEMVVWSHETTYWTEDDELPVDEDGNPTVAVGDVKKEAYTEDNEQLNKMAVSSVEGDPNVAGVFVNWDNDDDFNDMNVAMTGDMVIRIASGTTVQRGDLLMSAGDGTAKPQGDDIVRSKTIAKVTSTHVSHTYDDGSYLVPCVLMAC